MSHQSWSSPFASWHNRALLTPHPSPHAFNPTRDSLQLAVLLNAPIEHEGISLALFKDPTVTQIVAVDSLGRVLLVSEKDAVGILELARGALALPDTGAFRNTWAIKQPATSQPIHRIFIPSASGTDQLHEISVQGFSKEIRELREPVQDIQELPPVLWELTGLLLEARDGAVYGAERDEVVLGKVREAVGGLF
ncbi:hypothetical protein H0H81_006961 [Sphagnurus paluster]|uniref:Uncharacterized protein n=1 Tax=Sphagnurus paluster TaxID=117069 RepID=A0A9P7GR11_9AGAR|nr:hypothetical protein H0H81_006961 [Sphagnurus paluster]